MFKKPELRPLGKGRVKGEKPEVRPKGKELFETVFDVEKPTLPSERAEKGNRGEISLPDLSDITTIPDLGSRLRAYKEQHVRQMTEKEKKMEKQAEELRRERYRELKDEAVSRLLPHEKEYLQNDVYDRLHGAALQVLMMRSSTRLVETQIGVRKEQVAVRERVVDECLDGMLSNPVYGANFVHAAEKLAADSAINLTRGPKSKVRLYNPADVENREKREKEIFPHFFLGQDKNTASAIRAELAKLASEVHQDQQAALEKKKGLAKPDGLPAYRKLGVAELIDKKALFPSKEDINVTVEMLTDVMKAMKAVMIEEGAVDGEDQDARERYEQLHATGTLLRELQNAMYGFEGRQKMQIAYARQTGLRGNIPLGVKGDVQTAEDLARAAELARELERL